MYEQQKRLLIDELAQLNNNLQSIASKNPEVENDWVPTTNDKVHATADPNDQGDANEESLVNTAVTADLETRQKNVLRALKKIESNNYGQCELCEQPIEEDRLAVNPAARTCKTHLNDEASLTI